MSTFLVLLNNTHSSAGLFADWSVVRLPEDVATPRHAVEQAIWAGLPEDKRQAVYFNIIYPVEDKLEGAREWRVSCDCNGDVYFAKVIEIPPGWAQHVGLQ